MDITLILAKQPTHILPFNIYNVNKLKNAKVSNQTKHKLTHVINRSARIMVSDGYEYLFSSGRSVQGQDTPLTGIIIITFPRKQGYIYPEVAQL